MAEVAGANTAVPSNFATNACEPARMGNVKLACPCPFTGAVPTGVPQSVNVTVPQPGAPLPVVNEIVNVNDEPADG